MKNQKQISVFFDGPTPAKAKPASSEWKRCLPNFNMRSPYALKLSTHAWLEGVYQSDQRDVLIGLYNNLMEAAWTTKLALR